MRFSRGSHIGYILFLNSARNKRIRGFQLNKFINIKLKYEWLEHAGILDRATFKDQEQIVSETRINAKKNRILLFCSIKQGSRKNECYS